MRKPDALPVAACCLLLGLSACTSSPQPEPPQTEPPQADEAGQQVKRLEFETEIAAPVERVWETMLSSEGYGKWTSPFMEGSHFNGSWEEGERMHFLNPTNSGMVAVIAENRRHEAISIEHIGYVLNGVEDTTSPGVQSWAPSYEIYRFASVPGGTVVTIEQDAFASMEGYMSNVWPMALAELKALCEAN